MISFRVERVVLNKTVFGCSMEQSTMLMSGNLQKK